MYAPGNGLQWNDRPSDVSTGTSGAAASVSGLAAYWLSTDAFKNRPNPLPLERLGEDMRGWLMSHSWKRLDNGPAVIWNGFDYGSLTCPNPHKRPATDDPEGASANKQPNNGPKLRRDEGDEGEEGDTSLTDACGMSSMMALHIRSQD